MNTNHGGNGRANGRGGTGRATVAVLAAQGLDGVRWAYTTASSDVERVAALVEIAATAAALARHHVRLRRMNPEQIEAWVTRRVDLAAVLGRGRWLPTMTRPPRVSDPVRAARRTRTTSTGSTGSTGGGVGQDRPGATVDGQRLESSVDGRPGGRRRAGRRGGGQDGLFPTGEVPGRVEGR